jgi:dihydroxyacetone kinase-like protein
VSALSDAIQALATDVLAAQAELNRLDGIAGDGDLGATLALGANALLAALPELETLDTDAALRRCGSELARKAPSTCGTLLATACLRAAAAGAAPDTTSNETATGRIARLVSAGLAGIQQRGKANLGDKTLLDALAPAADALQAAASGGRDVADALAEAAAAARAGATATVSMRARVGRAGWLADRSEGHEDGGAWLIALLFESAARRAAARR